MIIKLEVDGHVRECVTLGTLAKMSGRTFRYLKKMEERGLLPDANYRMAEVQSKNGPIPGYRVYTRALAIKFSEIMKTQKKGTPISEADKQKIRDLFMAEKNGSLWEESY